MWGGLTVTERDRLHNRPRRLKPDPDVGLPAEARQCDTCTDDAVSGETMCTRCLTDSGIEWDRLERQAYRWNVNKKARRQRLRDAGLCTDCGRNDSRPGVGWCQPCADKQSARKRRTKANRLGVPVADLITESEGA